MGDPDGDDYAELWVGSDGSMYSPNNSPGVKIEAEAEIEADIYETQSVVDQDNHQINNGVLEDDLIRYVLFVVWCWIVYDCMFTY